MVAKIDEQFEEVATDGRREERRATVFVDRDALQRWLSGPAAGGKGPSALEAALADSAETAGKPAVRPGQAPSLAEVAPNSNPKGA